MRSFSNFHKECLRSVNARVFTNQMWTNGRRTKTNSKTSPEQSAIFQLVREINKTNCLITRKTAPPPWRFQLHRDIIGKNLLTKFHEDRTKNVSRVFTRKTDPPTGSHVFQQTRTTFELNQHIIKTNILTNFELDQDIFGTKLLTKFHEDRKRNVPSRKYTETNVLTKFHDNWAKNVTSRKNDPPTGGHVFSRIWTIFELVQDINKTTVLTNFHDDWAKIVTSRENCPAHRSHVFQRTGTTFELNQHIIKTNILTRLHEDLALNVTSTVFTSFELDRDLIGTKLLTKFHEDRTINVASRVFTNKCGRKDDGRTAKDRSQKLT
ncbi:hypothetical protein DPMN_095980 [Dreissena polymorpha]|uniref:Uncharacterized protein n=1 Tax=Dreissena polymorpha TaxID=45954 RepID=A0A9D4R393_DREPO|nr:hypothetical protein DPMN_095980 [Dreissena polymorpha]